ncbi:MAG: hypothetical protein Q9168_007020 [Polycauliona sp. 1 TL-2023]
MANSPKIPAIHPQAEISKETSPTESTNTSIVRLILIEIEEDQDPVYSTEASTSALLMQEILPHLPILQVLKGQGIALNAASTLDPNQIVVLATSKGPASHRALMQVIDNSKAVLQALSIIAVAAHLGQNLELLGALREREPRPDFVGRERSRAASLEPTEEEIAYLKSKDRTSNGSDLVFKGGAAKYRKQVRLTYLPKDMTPDTLQGMGPALACSEWGMNETIGERVIQVNRKQDEYDERIAELAQKVGEGVFCLFRSKQERVDTMKTVERNLAGQGDNAKLDEEQEKEKTALIDARMADERAKLATRLLKGDYHVASLGKGPTAQLLERYTQKNGSYMPEDSQALAGKIRTLLPLDKSTARVGGSSAART